MTASTNVLLAPPDRGTAGQVAELLKASSEALRAGESTVLLRPGTAVLANTKHLTTVLFVLVDVDDETRQRVYSYLHAFQSVTQRLRPVLLTDGDDLRAIRRYGWVLEHAMREDSFTALIPDVPWMEYLADRIRTSARRHDAGAVVMIGDEGITDFQHDRLCRRMKQQVPFASVRPQF